MTDAEIKQYLDENNWEVNANDCITPDNVFTFKWVLEKLDIGGYNHDYTA